ncbi:MAG: hypothetical protein LBK29_02020 [Oscillospiraceae bacterium]|nr:hypothetical protein [Oscillospiraceae bacterium]
MKFRFRALVLALVMASSPIFCNVLRMNYGVCSAAEEDDESEDKLDSGQSEDGNEEEDEEEDDNRVEDGDERGNNNMLASGKGNSDFRQPVKMEKPGRGALGFISKVTGAFSLLILSYITVARVSNAFDLVPTDPGVVKTSLEVFNGEGNGKRLTFTIAAAALASLLSFFANMWS